MDLHRRMTQRSQHANLLRADSSALIQNQLTDMKDAVIDMNGSVPGRQEGKEWLALMEYLSSMEDINLNNIPDINPKYKDPVKTFFLLK